MDPKRKRIYIIVIVVCVVASAVILLIGRFGGQSAAPVTQPAPAVQSAAPAAVSGSAKTGYTPPVIFPANPNFDFSVLDSSSFKQLQSYNAVVNQIGDLGRDDPFKSY